LTVPGVRPLTEPQSRRIAHPDFLHGELILLNLAIGGTAGGDPSATEFPSRVEVDYVRIYQKQ